MTQRSLIIRRLGLQPYESTWRSMRAFTDGRTSDTVSELWLLEHPPVFTLGQAGKTEHLLDTGDIPVVQTDRGGQVTYHGPGQLVLYLLVGLRECGLGVRGLVNEMENAVIDVLDAYGIDARARQDAPGVYVEGKKIASLGLRVRRGATYHGLALNVDNDLGPFSRINPCGFAGMDVSSTRQLGIEAGIDELGDALADQLARRLGYVPRAANGG